jgi:rhodanese-related sulfurtransferase
MKKNIFVAICILFVFCTTIPTVIFAASPPADEKKHTEAGKYVTAAEAYEMWKANPDKVKIIDCRIQEEYSFVGHAPMAYNIPSRLWTGKWNEEKKDYVLEDNPEFETQVKKKFAQDDTIMIMCRSGHRSAASVNRLTKAGFINVYNIVDGFEGEKVNGKRMKDGWKNSSAPWTYDLDPKLIYMPSK